MFDFLKTIVFLNPYVYRTQEGQKFHTNTCETLNKTDADKVVKLRVCKAKKQGLTACQVCEPRSWFKKF